MTDMTAWTLICEYVYAIIQELKVKQWFISVYPLFAGKYPVIYKIIFQIFDL